MEFVSADGFSDADYQTEDEELGREQDQELNNDDDGDDDEDEEQEEMESKWEAIVAARVEEQVRQREAEWNEFAVEIEQVRSPFFLPLSGCFVA